MTDLLKKVVMVLLLITSFACITSLYAENAEKLGGDAPTFSMYQYKDKVFNTDSIYGKKIITFIFGSIT